MKKPSSSKTSARTPGFAAAACVAARDKKAEAVRLLDLRRLTPYIDYFLLCSAGNQPHLKAVDEGICAALAQRGRELRRREGTAESGWVVLDFGDMVAHIFSPEMREFYDLDSRWGDARQIEVME